MNERLWYNGFLGFLGFLGFQAFTLHSPWQLFFFASSPFSPISGIWGKGLSIWMCSAYLAEWLPSWAL